MKRLITLLSLLSLSSFCLASESEPDLDFLGDLVIESPSTNNFFEFRGFFDTRWGSRFEQSDLYSDQRTLSESRLQSQLAFTLKEFKFKVKSDLLQDDISDQSKLEWREATIDLPENEHFSLRLGKQNILWGFGDLLAVNDQFPKDYNGLYFGRDAEAEYMVKSSNGLRGSWFFDDVSWDFMLIKFTPNDVPMGERLAYFNPLVQQVVGESTPLAINRHSDWVWMTRFNTRLMGHEFAFFYTDTRSLLPEAYDPVAQLNYYPKLTTIGMNFRRQWGDGILAYDAAYYDYREEKRGDNPFIPNDSYRHIIAYDVELAKELSLGVQWYYEKYRDHDAYLQTALNGMDQSPDYSLLTLRLRQMLLSQKMTLSLFVFHSVTQEDSYYRINLFHKFDDHWMVNIGSNYFVGSERARFGQLHSNSNYFAAIRYSF